MNEYLKNLVKLEFVVTDACTGRCKHCSEGEHRSCGVRIDAEIASDAVKRIAEEYEIKTVLVFGGEPLLHMDAVEKIIRAARDKNIPKRQMITNGYFSRDEDKIRDAVERIADCGVNDLLLSVDAFHQETIPLDAVRIFATEAKRCEIPIRLQPAWLVSPTNDNPYNRKTKEILECLADLMIPTSDGNVVFPEGNALKYLGEYFTDTPPENPYIEDPCDVKCLSFSPNGDLLDGNVYKEDVLKIIEGYTP